MNKLLLSLSLALSFLVPSVCSATFSTNLVGYYKLDETNGNAADATGGGATLTNNGTTPYAAALINNGANYGTSNTTKNFQKTTAFVTSGDFTYCAWYEPKTTPSGGATQIITVDENSTHNNRNQMYYWDNGGTPTLSWYRAHPAVGGTAGIDVAVTLSTSVFTHVCMTYSGTTLTAYKNAASQGTVTTSGDGGAALGNFFSIGDNGTSAAYAQGLEDEVGIWSRALSGAEITTLYNSGNGCAFASSNWTACATAVAAFNVWQFFDN